MKNNSNFFEPNLLEEIESFGTKINFNEGDTIIDYGKQINMMPLVTEGILKVLKLDEENREVLLYYLFENDTCSLAYTCCLEKKRSEVRVIAEESGSMIAIPHNKLDEWLCKYPSWKSFIMRSFNDRMMELLKTIENIAFKKLDERLIDYLLMKQKINNSTIIKVSHQLIAEELSTNRVVISRLLKQLEVDEKILLYRNEIKLLKKINE